MQQQRARGKRRTGYAYADSAPRARKLPRKESRLLRALAREAAVPAAQPVKQPGTVKAQLLGKLGPRGYQRLVGELREITEEAA